MGYNSEYIEIHDEEAGQDIRLNVTQLVADVRDAFIGKRRSQVAAILWDDMTEGQRDDEIQAMTILAEDIVHGCCNLIAAGGRDVVHATLDNFKVKGGEVTVTAKGRADNEALIKLNGASQTKTIIKMVILDEGEFDQHRSEAKNAKDEPEMFGDGDGGKDKDVDFDDLIEQAVKVVTAEQVCSTSFIQRRLAISYSKAAAVVEALEVRGLVSEPDDVGKRTVLVSQETEEADSETPDEAPEDQDLDAVAADMDADLDAIDDLHSEQGEDEAEADVEADVASDEAAADPETDVADDAAPEQEQDQDPQKDLTPEEISGLGFQLRIEGGGLDQNPYDGGTDEHGFWTEGYRRADIQIETLKTDGYEAAKAGKKESVCTYDAGSDAHRFWMIGYLKRKDEEESA